MDALERATQNQGAVLLTVAAVLVAATLLVLNRSNGEKAVIFKVPLPQQCEPGWRGEILDTPSIKVCLTFFFPIIGLSKVLQSRKTQARLLEKHILVPSIRSGRRCVRGRIRIRIPRH